MIQNLLSESASSMEDLSRDIDTIDDTYQNILPYMIQNIPVLVRSSPKAWSSIQMDLCQLRNRSDFCRKCICAVVECNDACLKLKNGTSKDIENSNEYSSQTRISSTLEAFFKRVLDSKEENIYLKDWHLDQIPDLNFEYRVPLSFTDDWLNWYWKSCRASDGDDYSFLYMGGARTYTSLHHDVCCSNSWSMNLFGYKKWTLWPPSESCKLSRNYHVPDEDQDLCAPIPFRQRMAAPLSDSSVVVDPRSRRSENCQNSSATDRIDVAVDIHKSNIDQSIFAKDYNETNTHDGNDMVADARDGHYDKILYKGVALSNPIVFVQSVGEAVFVPSGWYHQVENLPQPNRKVVIEDERKEEAEGNGQFMIGEVRGEVIGSTKRNCDSTISVTTDKEEIFLDGQNEFKRSEITETLSTREQTLLDNNECVVEPIFIEYQSSSGLEDTNSRSIRDLTVSLNRNWFNGFSLYEVWLFLCRELDAVREELWYLKPSWRKSDIFMTSLDEISSSYNSASDECHQVGDHLQINRDDCDKISLGATDIDGMNTVTYSPDMISCASTSTINIINKNSTYSFESNHNNKPLNNNRTNNSGSMKFGREKDTTASSVKSGKNGCIGTAMCCGELPPMGIVEWHKHSEVLLRANSAINLKEFLELIAARVLMMDTCKNILRERRKGREAVGNLSSQSKQADICRDDDRKTRGDILKDVCMGVERAQNQWQDQDISHISSSLGGCDDVGGWCDNVTDENNVTLPSNILSVAPNDRTPSRSHRLPSSWHSTLCPRYKRESVTEEDIEMFSLLSATTMLEKNCLTSKCNYLSHFIIHKKRGEFLDHQELHANDDSSSSAIFISLLADFPKRNVQDGAQSLKSPFVSLSALELTCRQLELVISDMISSQSVLLHLSCSLLPESTAEATDTETSIARSYIFHGCDDHLIDLHNLLDCVSKLYDSS